MAKYMVDIRTSLLRLQECLYSSDTTDWIFEAEENLDLFFIVLSSMPSDALNSLYLHISQYLPADLMVESSEGKPVRVQGFFQMPSPDINFMIEKN